MNKIFTGAPSIKRALGQSIPDCFEKQTTRIFGMSEDGPRSFSTIAIQTSKGLDPGLMKPEGFRVQILMKATAGSSWSTPRGARCPAPTKVWNSVTRPRIDHNSVLPREAEILPGDPARGRGHTDEAPLGLSSFGGRGYEFKYLMLARAECLRFSADWRRYLSAA